MAGWVLGAAALWVGGACALALLLGAVLRRGRDERFAPAPPAGAPPVPARRRPVRVSVPAPRPAPVTPPHGLRSQAHLSCADRVVR